VDERGIDVEACRKLADRMRGLRMKLMRGGPLSGQLIKGQFGYAIGIIGTSHHFNAFALAQGVPALAVFNSDDYRQKAQGQVALWGDERFALPFSELHVQAASSDDG
jgi:hypothetical protein